VFQRQTLAVGYSVLSPYRLGEWKGLVLGKLKQRESAVWCTCCLYWTKKVTERVDWTILISEAFTGLGGTRGCCTCCLRLANRGIGQSTKRQAVLFRAAGKLNNPTAPLNAQLPAPERSVPWQDLAGLHNLYDLHSTESLSQSIGVLCHALDAVQSLDSVRRP